MTAATSTNPIVASTTCSPSRDGDHPADLGDHQPPDHQHPPGRPQPAPQGHAQHEQERGVDQARHDRDGEQGDGVVRAVEVAVPRRHERDDEHESGEQERRRSEAIGPTVLPHGPHRLSSVWQENYRSSGVLTAGSDGQRASAEADRGGVDRESDDPGADAEDVHALGGAHRPARLAAGVDVPEDGAGEHPADPRTARRPCVGTRSVRSLASRSRPPPRRRTTRCRRRRC